VGTQLRIVTGLAGAAETSNISLLANGDASGDLASLTITSGGLGDESTIILGANHAHITGDLEIGGSLKVYNNSATYTGYVFVPLTTARTNTSYDGDAVNTGVYPINLQDAAGYNLPAGIKAIAARISAVWSDIGTAPAGNYAYLRARGSTGAAIICRAQAAGYYNDASGVVACDTTYGDVDLVVGGANASGIVIEIYGYWI